MKINTLSLGFLILLGAVPPATAAGLADYSNRELINELERRLENDRSEAPTHFLSFTCRSSSYSGTQTVLVGLVQSIETGRRNSKELVTLGQVSECFSLADRLTPLAGSISTSKRIHFCTESRRYTIKVEGENSLVQTGVEGGSNCQQIVDELNARE